AAWLNVRIHSGPGPVPVHGEYARIAAADRLRMVDIRRDARSKPALKRHSLDGVAVADDRAEDLRLEGARLIGYPAERAHQPAANRGQSLIPAGRCRQREWGSI